jgi:N-formylmaleamate deformylase
VLPDARGHGLSDAPEEDYSTGARAADLAVLIKELGLERPVVGGHSMGAGTALRMVAEHPDLARAAILEDPGLRDAPRGGAAASEDEAAVRRERMRRNAEEMKALGKEGLVARQRERTPHWPEGEYEPWAESKLQVSERYTTARRGDEGPGWRELLPRVTCPTLLITADPERGAIVTPEIAAEAQRLLPSLKVVRIEGAGHSVRRDRFDEYVRVVREFLRGV